MAERHDVIMAFTTEQIARLSGISVSRLRYWETTEAFLPERIESIVPGPYSRIYTFRDLVNLRVMADLRRNRGIGLQQLRSVSRYIADYPNVPWSSLALRVYGSHLEFRDPQNGQWMSTEPLGQYTLELEFDDVRLNAERDARSAMRRSADQLGGIVRSRTVMSNQWVFDGTRIPVASVIRMLDAGYSASDVIRSYPTLTDEDIVAAKAARERELRTA